MPDYYQKNNVILIVLACLIIFLLITFISGCPRLEKHEYCRMYPTSTQCPVNRYENKELKHD